MKKVFLATGMVVVAMALTMTARASAPLFLGFPIVNVTLNGKVVSSDVPAVNLHGRAMLPIRVIAELLKLNVKWNQETSTAELTSPVTADKTSSATPLADVAAMGEEEFEEYLYSEFGRISGVSLTLSALPDNLFVFATSDNISWKNTGYEAKLEWIKALTAVMEMRYPKVPFSASLSVRLEFENFPTAYPEREISLDHNAVKWVVRHQVLATRRLSLPFYGVQPISVTVND